MCLSVYAYCGYSLFCLNCLNWQCGLNWYLIQTVIVCDRFTCTVLHTAQIAYRHTSLLFLSSYSIGEGSSCVLQTLSIYYEHIMSVSSQSDCFNTVGPDMTLKCGIIRIKHPGFCAPWKPADYTGRLPPRRMFSTCFPQPAVVKTAGLPGACDWKRPNPV